MKKQVVMEVTCCDNCGARYAYEKCLGCGKDFCSDCASNLGQELHHAVFYSGSEDGFFCNNCMDNLPNLPESSRKLYNAYVTIQNLRSELQAWHTSFDDRRKEAEEQLRNLRDDLPA